jgi:hypothetical protein
VANERVYQKSISLAMKNWPSSPVAILLGRGLLIVVQIAAAGFSLRHIATADATCTPSETIVAVLLKQ